jgi:radical SAM superfamily enzyme YgiQ (UPF0313 family)
MSVVRKEGHQVFFIDNYLRPSNFIEEGFLQRHQIDYVGIHTNTICFRDTLKMVEQIEGLRREGLWSGRIIVGGPHTSVDPEGFPEYVDHIVQGEGETAVLDILAGRMKGRWIRKERIKDLNFLPFEPWDLFSKLPYDDTCPWLEARPVFTMNTSRGCPFHCSFCSIHTIWEKECTFFCSERIISEIEYLMMDFGAKGIYFREDNFTLNRGRVDEFCRGLIGKGMRIHWACESRVDALCDEELVALMSLAGCRAVYLGVESGSQKILNTLRKGITVEQIEKALRLCKRHQIKTYCSLICGVPGETYEDYLQTEKLMHQLKPDQYSFNVFVGIPDSPLYQEIVKTRLYEYIDDIGLVYLPGYHVKAKYFYDIDSENLVDYKFRQKTKYDKKLLKDLRWKSLKGLLGHLEPRRIKPASRNR